MHAPKLRGLDDKPKTLTPVLTRDFIKEQIALNQPVDFSDIFAQIDVHIARLGWTKNQVAAKLKRLYGETHRRQLDDTQLIKWLEFLEVQSGFGGVSGGRLDADQVQKAEQLSPESLRKLVESISQVSTVQQLEVWSLFSDTKKAQIWAALSAEVRLRIQQLKKGGAKQ